MTTVVIQYRIKGEHAEEPVHTFEVRTDNDSAGVSLYDMKKRVAEDNSITKWLIPSMRVLNRAGERPESGIADAGDVYTVSLYGGSPELEGALPCFSAAKVADECIPRLKSFKDSTFLNGLIRHTFEDAQKWYRDTEEILSIRVTLDSLIRGLSTLAKVTENIRVLIGEDETEFVALLCKGIKFVKDVFMDAPEAQRHEISCILIRYLHLFATLTPSKFAWTVPGPEKNERFDPIFSVVTKRVLGQGGNEDDAAGDSGKGNEMEREEEGKTSESESNGDENGLLDTMLDMMGLLGKESRTGDDLEVVKECSKTLGAIAYRNMVALEVLGSEKGRPFFEIFKKFLFDDDSSSSSSSSNRDIDLKAKNVLFEIRRVLVQFIMLGSEYSTTFSKCADEYEILDTVRKVIFWTLEAFESSSVSSGDSEECYCNNEGYIIVNIGENHLLHSGKKECEDDGTCGKLSPELSMLVETVKYISFRETMRSEALLRFLTSELFDPAKMPPGVRSIIETSPYLQYTLLEILGEYIGSGKPSRVNKLFTQELLDVLFSRFFMQIGLEADEKTGEMFLSTKKSFVRLRLKTCELILMASYASKEARSLVITNLHRISAETNVADVFVICSEIMTSMFSHFVFDDKTQTLMSDEILDIINMVLPIYRENVRRKGTVLNSKPFKSAQMRYESSRCILMNSSFSLLKNPTILPKIIENERIINFFFDMLRDTGVQTFSLSCIVKIMSAPIESDEQEQTRRGVYTKFLECVRGFIRENSADEFEMEVQLLRAVGEVCLAGRRYQHIMINSGVFPVIMSLLTHPIEGHPDRKDKLVEECLSALYYVLIGCEKNKASFKKCMGYNNLTSTLRKVVETVSDQRIVTSKLFDMLVETRIKWGTGSSSDVIPTIRNSQILFVILDLVSSLKTDNVVHTLTRFIELLSSMPNRNICCKCGVLTYLLDAIDYYSGSGEEAKKAMVKRKISFSTRINSLFIEIIHILGSHTLSASELKHLIRILSFSGPSKTRLPDFPYLIYALHQMPSSTTTPESYFGFNGISSEFTLPKFEKGVFSKGLTISMWIRVESYKKPVIDVGFDEVVNAPAYYDPVLLSLNNSENHRIEIFLHNKMLGIRVSSPEASLTSTFGTYCVPEQEWICVGITVSSTSIIGFRSTLYIDGVQTGKVSSKYQRIGSFTNNMLGGSPTDPVQSFFGQIGCFNMFGDTLSQGQMKAIYELGPNYLGLFREDEMKGLTSSGGSFDNDHILSYNARAQKGKFILNACAAYASSSARIKDVETCIVTKIKDVIGCSEGIKVLFPLILMLNKPSHPEFTSPYTDQQLLIYIIELINDLVTSSKEIEDDMIKNKGYVVLSHILKKIPSNCFSPELIKFVNKSCHCMVRSNELQKYFVQDFVMDFFLWVYTSVETQRELFAMLRDMHRAGRTKLSAWLILAIMQLFYWTRSENREWCMCTTPRLSPVTKAVIGVRPPESKIEEIRRAQYDILRQQLEKNDFERDDIQSVIAFLCMETSDTSALIGVVRVISSFFDPPASKGFATKFYEERGLDVLVGMLSTGSEDLLIAVVGAIQMLVAALSSNTHFCSKVNAVAAAMHNNLSDHVKLTLPMYKMFLDMCITENPIPMAGSTGQDAYILAYPEILCHCVLGLAATADEAIRIAAIHDVCLLLERPANVEKLIAFPGWQGALTDVIIAQLASSAELRHDVSAGTPPERSVYNTDDALSAEEETKCARGSTFDVICTILKSIGFTAIVGPSEWKAFENMLAALQTAELKNGGLTNIIYYMKLRFYKALTDSLKPKAGMQESMLALYKKGSPQFQKACYAIVFMVDDIFAMHSNNPLSDGQSALTVLHNVVNFMAVSRITCTRDWCGCDKPKPESSVVGASLGLRNGGFAGLYIWVCVNIVKMKYVADGGAGYANLHNAVDHLCMYCEETLPGFFGAFNDDFYYVARFILKTCDNFRATDDAEYFTSVLDLLMNKFIKKRMKKFADESTTFLNKAITAVADSSTKGGENDSLAAAISADEGVAKKACRFRNDVLRRNVAVGLKANTAFVESVRIYTTKVSENEARLLIEEAAATEAVMKERRAQAMRRLQQSCRVLRDVNAEAAHIWRKIIRSLSSGKGPWGTAEGIVNWKLDETENTSRMRIKMKRNYAFDMHQGAAVVSARSRQASAPPTPTLKFATEISAAKDAWMMLSTKLSSKKASKARRKAKKEKGRKDGAGANGGNDGEEYEYEEEEEEEEEEEVDEVDEIEKREGETKTLYETECNVIRPGKIYTGNLTVKKDGIIFVEGIESKRKDSKRAKKMFWPADMIKEVHFRRYLLVHTALEIFFSDSTNVFLNFATVKTKEIVYRKIVSGIEPPNLAYSNSKTPQEILESSGLTEQWVHGEISNFDYLMKLNTIAGRTYNDLRQYPVFPWIIADYTSESLDFSNPATFRDLSKPVGALNPKRLETFRQRYEGFCDPNVPAFMYATHYSSADITFFYMLRVEPFTSYYVKHLRGRFDLADRMFGSIPKTWHNCLHGNSDIKELIPEFFYFPEFLRNSNHFDFGETQAGVKLDDVVLPPWAHGSPEEFIRMNRAALESPYVSAHLHEWIDLIFGYKQRGEEAIKADNIFCFFTYEGAVDISKIDNEIDRVAMRDQIANFGQTPSQLLTRPHPPRMVAPTMTAPVTPSFLHEGFFAHLNGFYKKETITVNSVPRHRDKRIVFVATPETFITDLSFSFISSNPNRLITADCLYNIHTTINTSNMFLLSEFKKDSDLFNKDELSINESGDNGPNGGDNSSSNNNSNSNANGNDDDYYFDKELHCLMDDNFAVEKTQRIHGIKDEVNNNSFSMSESGAFMICCRFWDNSFRILSLEEESSIAGGASVVQKVTQHKDLVTCVCFDEVAGVVATGSRDTSIMLWNVVQDNPLRVNEHPFNVLYGHNDKIVSLDMNVELDIVASGAKDGCLMVHTIRNGGFVWSAQASEPGYPTMKVKISPNGNIVVYVPQRDEIIVYNVNGRVLCSKRCESVTLQDCYSNEDENEKRHITYENRKENGENVAENEGEDEEEEGGGEEKGKKEERERERDREEEEEEEEEEDENNGYGETGVERERERERKRERERERDVINDMKIIFEGDVLVTCGNKMLRFWRLCDLKVCFSMELESPGCCIHVSSNGVFYYIGMKNGRVLVLKA